LFFIAGPGVYSVKADGSGLTRVATADPNALYQATFSPDGSHVAWPCRPDGDQSMSQTELCLQRTDGSDKRTAAQSGLDPPGFLTVVQYGSGEIVWSPDGQRVAFLVLRVATPDVVSSGDVYVYDLQSGQSRRVDEGAFAELRSPMRWSPDSRHIAVPVAQRIGAEGAMRIIDIGDEHSPPSSRDVGHGSILEDYRWSPDGSTLAYAGSDAPGTSNVYVVPAAGTASDQLTSGIYVRQIVWSPDARSLALTVIDQGHGALYVVSAAGGDATPLTPGLRVDGPPAWSPDSGTIAFVVEGPQPDTDSFPDAGLFTVPAAGGTPKRVTQDQRIVLFPLITWSPDGKRIFYTAEGGDCIEGCPPGPLFMVPADGSSPPVAITTSDVLVFQLLSWH
jgi:Tol biopolymer transport system component